MNTAEYKTDNPPSPNSVLCFNTLTKPPVYEENRIPSPERAHNDQKNVAYEPPSVGQSDARALY